MITPDGSRRPAGLAAWLAAVAPRRARGDVTVALVSDRRMRSLNRTFRGVDRVTDVLSFPAFAQASAGEPA
ncbi:MAG: rRNA maturation RNAse YbeY, partial [Vicinamibacterales bacterium]